MDSAECMHIELNYSMTLAVVAVMLNRTSSDMQVFLDEFPALSDRPKNKEIAYIHKAIFLRSYVDSFDQTPIEGLRVVRNIRIVNSRTIQWYFPNRASSSVLHWRLPVESCLASS